MPNSAIDDGEEEEHVDQVQELVDLRGLRRLVLGRGSAPWARGTACITFLIAAVFAGRDAALGVHVHLEVELVAEVLLVGVDA